MTDTKNTRELNPVYQSIKNMVQMQYELSFKLAGTDWLFNPAVDTTTAMLKESVELIDSAGYTAWWVKGEPALDPENCKTEVVDLFHFLMQGCLQQAWRMLDAVRDLEPENTPQHVKDMLSDDNILVPQVADWFYDAYCSYDEFGPQLLARNDVHVVNYWLSQVLQGAPMSSLAAFWEMCYRFGLTLEDLNARYLAKNVLNQFRRDANYKGDKEGMPAYVKLWDGVHEDNWHVLDYVKYSRTPADIYRVMQALYKHHTGITVGDVPEITTAGPSMLYFYMQVLKERNQA